MTHPALCIRKRAAWKLDEFVSSLLQLFSHEIMNVWKIAITVEMSERSQKDCKQLRAMRMSHWQHKKLKGWKKIEPWKYTEKKYLVMNERHHEATVSQKLRGDGLKRQKKYNEAIKRPSSVSRAGIRGKVRKAFTLGKNI